MNKDPRKQGRVAPKRQNAPTKNPSRPKKDESELVEFLRELFSKENLSEKLKLLQIRSKQLLGTTISAIFLARERIICGVVTCVILVFLALLQTTLFSTLRPFGAVPDLMLSFVLALAVSEGRKWGAAWGIVAAVVIESLSVPDVYLLPLLYMPLGYVCGILCKNLLTESAAVRAVITLAAIPLKGAFTAIYMTLSPMSATAGEIFFRVVLPEAAATLILAAPVHLLVFLCMKPFHHTRAEMVER